MKTGEQKKKTGFSIVVLLLFTFLVWKSEENNTVFSENGSLLRYEPGEGEYEAEVMLEIDEAEGIEWKVLVPEQKLTKEEEQDLLFAAMEEIEAEFAGENESMEKIQNKVIMHDTYQDGKVTAEWEFSNYELIAESGVIVEDAMTSESETVEAKVNLTCEDSAIIYEFCFVVYKREKTEEELFYEKLNQFISESGEQEGTEFLRLPKELEGHSLIWKDKKSKLSLQVFALGLIVMILLPALEAEKEKEAQKKREEELMLEYSELLNKLTLLLGAGMTLQGAWRQITAKYTEKNRKKGVPYAVYEEMLITLREIESGKGEMKAYEAFGARCGLARYRKLSGYLVQNMKKGNQGLCELLNREAEEAFEERKNLAKQYGEKAGTKLLLPMLLMLGIVIFIIMIPAVISFQSGVN